GREEGEAKPRGIGPRVGARCGGEVLIVRTSWLWLVLVPGCLFDGAQTTGLPCNNDAECGPGIGCIERVCGGPTIAADTDSDTDTEVDELEDESESSTGDDD